MTPEERSGTPYQTQINDVLRGYMEQSQAMESDPWREKALGLAD